jgi:hypothetical protein
LYDDNTDLTTYTFADADIGIASDDRIVVVSIHSDGGANKNVTACTIGGNPATLINTTPTTPQVAAIAYLPVASGPTATIVVEFSGAALRCRIAIWTAKKTLTTPIDTANPVRVTAAQHTVNLDLPTNSAALVVQTLGTANRLSTWNMGVERFDDALESNCTAAAVEVAGTGNLGVNITSTHTSDPGAIVGVVWGEDETAGAINVLVGTPLIGKYLRPTGIGVTTTVS